jgi:hypothetical protein
MTKRYLISFLFIAIAIVLGIVFFSNVVFPKHHIEFFKAEQYNQFAPIALCIELLIAGFYLLKKHPKTNFALALFGFTAILDPIFDLIGLFNSLVPVYGTVIFIICAPIALWLAFTNTFGLGKITFLNTLLSFLSGCAIELFFNYF